MDSTSSATAEDDVTSSTHFIPRRRPPPQHSSGNFRRSTSRPHSIGATIISNPKLVKGWQYYDSSLNQRDIQKYFSTVHLGGGTSTEETFLDLHQQERQPQEGAAGGTGTKNIVRSSGSSGSVGAPNNIRVIHDSSGGIMVYEEEEDEDTIAAGVEIKASVAKKEKQGCLRAFVKISSPILGIFLTLVASSVLALSSALIEGVSTYQYHHYSVLVWTSQGLFWLSFVLLLCPCQMKSIALTKPEAPLSRTNNKLFTILLIFLRAIFGWTAVLLSQASLQCISEDTSTFITWTSPIFVLLVAWILLGEKSGWIPLISAVVAALGVGLIAPPSFVTGERAVVWNKSTIVGCLLAGGAMISEGIFSVIILRHIRHVHFALITFVYGLVGMAGGGFLYFFHNDKFQLPAGGGDTWLAVILCVLVFLGQTGIIGALKYEQAGIFAVVRCWFLPMFVVWRYWFLGKNSDWLSFIGSLVILSGVFVLIARKLVYSHARSRRTRRCLGFLLI